LAQDALRDYLRAPDAVPIWILSMLLVASAFLALNNAFLQGSQHMGWLGGLLVVGALGKIFFGVALVSLGYGATGAMLGVLCATAATWLAGLALMRPSLPKGHPSGAETGGSFPVAAIVPVLIASVAFTGMTQLDMVLVNHYFDADQAGQYAAASVLGKAVLYLPGGLVIALYPMVAGRYASRQGSAHLLVQSALAVLIVCGSAAAVYWLLGPWLVGLFYGAAYAPAGELLALYGWAVLPMALVMVAEHFLIAQGRVLFAWLFLAVAPLQLLVIHLWHPDLRSVILVIGAGGAVMALVGYGMLLREYFLLTTAQERSTHQ
jgi:O-antigen/teichoic acid export membrane protein